MSRIFSQITHGISAEKQQRILEVLDQWHEAERLSFVLSKEYEHTLKTFDEREEKHAHIGAKYIRMDVGSSGAFLLEIATGDIFGIKGYGVVNRAKCVGNINDPDFNGAVLFTDRFRYGRFDNRKAVTS